MKITANKNGSCGVLMNEHERCDFRFEGKLLVCNYMHQSTGRCMCKSASVKKKKHRGRSPWDDANDATFAEYMSEKEKRLSV